MLGKYTIEEKDARKLDQCLRNENFRNYFISRFYDGPILESELVTVEFEDGWEKDTQQLKIVLEVNDNIYVLIYKITNILKKYEPKFV